MSAEPKSAHNLPVGLQDRQNRDVVLKVSATPCENQMKLAKVSMEVPEGGPWTMLCDEGKYLGGDNSAPPPLSFFAASIAFCMLTQLGRYVKIMRMKVDSISLEVTARFHIEGSVKEGTLRGMPLTFTFATSIASPEPADRIAALIETAESSCYVTQSLINPVQIERDVELNGNPFEPAGTT